MPSILFICTANQFRSPLAEASLKEYLTEHNILAEWKVESAGTWTMDGRPVLQVTRQNAERLGLSGIETHKSRQVTGDLLDSFDLIIVMEAGQKEALNIEFKSTRGRVFMLTEVIGSELGDIPDPILLGIPADDIATEIHSMIMAGADKILELARDLSYNRKIQ